MLGNKQYELSNHLGNVLTTVSDRKIAHSTSGTTIDYYTADITSAQDYYCFGEIMPGRNFNSNSYKFGFNGKLNDNEVYGSTGTFQDYGKRMYDTRICRFISVDPITNKYPELTPYQFASNNPIWAIDLDGEEAKVVIHLKKVNEWSSSGTTLFIYKATFVLVDMQTNAQKLLNMPEQMYIAQGSTVSGNLVSKTVEQPILPDASLNHSSLFKHKGDGSLSFRTYQNAACTISNGCFVHGFGWGQGAVGGYPPWSTGCQLPFYFCNVTITPGVNVVENKTSANPDQDNEKELTEFHNLITGNNSVVTKPDGTQVTGAYEIWDDKDASSLGMRNQSTTPDPANNDYSSGWTKPSNIPKHQEVKNYTTDSTPESSCPSN